MVDTAAPSSSLSAADRDTLLRIAGRSIAHGLRFGSVPTIFLLEFSPPLRLNRASFATLEINHKLRGCIGSLAPVRPLVEDVAHSAFGAAFRDPRFAPVTPDELPRLSLHLSIFNPAEPMSFTSEADLLAQIRPRVDGLILADEPAPGQGRRGTFLPSVWDTLPDPKTFLEHLKLKAGLTKDHWSATVKVWRYTTESIP